MAYETYLNKPIVLKSGEILWKYPEENTLFV